MIIGYLDPSGNIEAGGIWEFPKIGGPSIVP